MTDFVRIASTAPIVARATYRVVAVDHESLVFGFPDHFRFSDAFNDWYAQMYARTGSVYPVSPNPAHSITSLASYDTDSPAYVVDVQAADTTPDGLTAVDLVRLLEAITNRVKVAQFVSIDANAVGDPESRDQLQQEAAASYSASSPFVSLGHWATLAVVALVALAAIQISKDL